MKKKTFDAVAFMRKRREEFSRAYAGLTAEQIQERLQQSLKNDPLWSQQKKDLTPSPIPMLWDVKGMVDKRRKEVGCPLHSPRT